MLNNHEFRIPLSKIKGQTIIPRFVVVLITVDFLLQGYNIAK